MNETMIPKTAVYELIQEIETLKKESILNSPRFNSGDTIAYQTCINRIWSWLDETITNPD